MGIIKAVADNRTDRSFSTVTDITNYISDMFGNDIFLNRVSVTGEVSNCKYHSSGHLYFTLKDSNSSISAVMYANNLEKLSFEISEGMKIIVHGRVGIYKAGGTYKLYANSIEQVGIGNLYLELEKLKRQYQDMGYFSDIYKQKIPLLSRRVGIVTSPTGAAIQDIKSVAYRRNPYVSLILCPALVQGKGAAESIVSGIRRLDEMNLDVIIVGRGGGSIEDLWAFNEEIVVEAIFNAKTPIISAVGHETDFTVADFVADLRAPTPSAAAEHAVARLDIIEQKIDGHLKELNACMSRIIDNRKQRITAYSLKLKFLAPYAQLDQKKSYLLSQREKLDNIFNSRLKEYRHRLEVCSSRLHGVSPLEKLSQGYSYTENAAGEPIASVKDTCIGDKLSITVKDGIIAATVDSIKEDNYI